MKKVHIWRKSAFYEKCRISHLRYSKFRIDSSIRTGFFVYYFRKVFSDLKNVYSISSGFSFAKLEKIFLIFKLKGYLFFQNLPLLQIRTFSLGQKECAYFEKSAYYECAYYERAQYNII